MLSGMESSEASRQISEVQKLQASTAGEALRARPLAMPVLGVATIVFFSSFASDNRWLRIVAPVVWTMFLVVWVRWLRGANRARPRAFGGYEWRRDLPLWLGLFVLTNLLMLVGRTVSWLLAGILMALVSAGSGLFAALRRRA